MKTEINKAQNPPESKPAEIAMIRLAEKKLRAEILWHSEYLAFCKHAAIPANPLAALPKLHAQLDLTGLKKAWSEQ